MNQPALLVLLLTVGNGLKLSDNVRNMHPNIYSRPNRQANQNEVEDAKFWFDSAQRTLSSQLKMNKIEKQAKNVIFFLGDGMSVPTVTAARIFKGQRVDKLPFGEEGSLHMDTFPHVAVSKTFCSNGQVADSACTSTAYLCGTKANVKTIGVTPAVTLNNCTQQMNEANHVSSILAWSQAAGKSTGLVTTSRITDASPVGLYAHIAQRDWEDDVEIRKNGEDPEICDDISEQLILKKPGQDINVIFGGGRIRFLPNTTEDPEDGFGTRGDGKDLTQECLRLHPENSKYVTNKTEFLKIDTSTTDYVFGLFAAWEMGYLDTQDEEDDPSLEEMTRVAIEILSRNPNGYFLFVEGGRIDHAHHATNAQRALWETIEFDKAIKKADEMTSVDDTLITVTADHAHVMSISGYPDRGESLMSIAGIADDHLPHSTLSYANGPGYQYPENGHRYNISGDNLEHIDYRQISTAPLDSETHGGDDVLIFSRGPFAHLLTGVQMQNYIPHVLGYASCVGDRLKFCDEKGAGGGGSSTLIIFHSLLTILIFVQLFK